MISRSQPATAAADRGRDALRVVRLDRQAVRLAACLAGLGGQHQRVGVGDLPGPGLLADRPHLVPGRQDHDHRAPPDEQLRHARRGGGRDVGGAQPVPLGQQQLARAHVLADRPNVLVGGHGRADLRGLAVVVHVLAHHHRVPAGRHRVAGVHHVVGVRRQVDRGGLARAEGVRGAHRDPVHAGRVERRRRADRPHRPGGDQPGRLGHRHQRRRDPGRAARGRTRVAPGRQGPGGRDVADERAVGRHVPPQR